MTHGETPAEQPNSEGGEQPPEQSNQPREDSASTTAGVDDWRAETDEVAGMEAATGQGGTDPSTDRDSFDGPSNEEGSLVQAPAGGKFGSDEPATDEEAEQLQSFGARAQDEMQREA
ncbi:MAG: hypothetical protein WA892_15175 [Ornithinimicrobium sp.]